MSYDSKISSSTWSRNNKRSYLTPPLNYRKKKGKDWLQIYTMMQGPSEFGIMGRLANWDITQRLGELNIPVLMVGAKYDTMDPKAMEKQSTLVKKGRYLYCPNGSHLSMWDDQEVFMKGVIKFIKDVDEGSF